MFAFLRAAKADDQAGFDMVVADHEFTPEPEAAPAPGPQYIRMTGPSLERIRTMTEANLDQFRRNRVMLAKEVERVTKELANADIAISSEEARLVVLKSQMPPVVDETVDDDTAARIERANAEIQEEADDPRLRMEFRDVTTDPKGARKHKT